MHCHLHSKDSVTILPILGNFTYIRLTYRMSDSLKLHRWAYFKIGPWLFFFSFMSLWCGLNQIEENVKIQNLAWVVEQVTNFYMFASLIRYTYLEVIYLGSVMTCLWIFLQEIELFNSHWLGISLLEKVAMPSKMEVKKATPASMCGIWLGLQSVDFKAEPSSWKKWSSLH